MVQIHLLVLPKTCDLIEPRWLAAHIFLCLVLSAGPYMWPTPTKWSRGCRVFFFLPYFHPISAPPQPNTLQRNFFDKWKEFFFLNKFYSKKFFFQNFFMGCWVCGVQELRHFNHILGYTRTPPNPTPDEIFWIFLFFILVKIYFFEK